MTGLRVAKLQEMGVSFGPEAAGAKSKAERRRLWLECDRINRAAHARVGPFAERLDLLRASCPDPGPLVLSDTFWARERDLTAKITAEWLSQDPDLERFERLVAAWESNCKKEIEAQVKKTRKGRIESD